MHWRRDASASARHRSPGSRFCCPLRPPFACSLLAVSLLCLPTPTSPCLTTSSRRSCSPTTCSPSSTARCEISLRTLRCGGMRAPCRTRAMTRHAGWLLRLSDQRLILSPSVCRQPAVRRALRIAPHRTGCRASHPPVPPSAQLPKQNSAIMLGEPLKSMYSGDMQWIGVSKPFYWEVRQQSALRIDSDRCRALLEQFDEPFRPLCARAAIRARLAESAAGPRWSFSACIERTRQRSARRSGCAAHCTRLRRWTALSGGAMVAARMRPSLTAFSLSSASLPPPFPRR